jgi:glycosyltransferase involved in cell wall biosynthesis
MYWLLQPPGEQISGGYLFNRRIDSASRSITRRLQVTAQDFPRLLVQAIRSGSGIVVDSLLLDDDEVLDRLEAAPQVNRVGLIHYLPSDDPLRSLKDHTRAIDRLCRLPSVLDLIIAPSEYVKRKILRIAGAGSRVTVIRPGVDRSIYESRRHRTWPPRAFLTVAHVLPTKGFRIALEALRPLRAVKWRWTIVGGLESTPDYVASLRNRAKRIGVDDRIDLIGMVDPGRIATLYAEADLFLFPSLFESYGMVCAEAVTNALPVIASRTGAIPEIVQGSGILVPPLSVTQFRGAVDRLAKRSHYLPLARRAFRRAHEFQTWEASGADLDSVLSNPLKTHK